jgi:hypothetical protein
MGMRAKSCFSLVSLKRCSLTKRHLGSKQQERAIRPSKILHTERMDHLHTGPAGKRIVAAALFGVSVR